MYLWYRISIYFSIWYIIYPRYACTDLNYLHHPRHCEVYYRNKIIKCSIYFLLEISIHRLNLLRIHKTDCMGWRKSNWNSRTEELIMLKQRGTLFHFARYFTYAYLQYYQIKAFVLPMYPEGHGLPWHMALVVRCFQNVQAHCRKGLATPSPTTPLQVQFGK